MNRKEFQEWLNNFPEDTKIEVIMAYDFWSGDKPKRIEFQTSEEEIKQIQYLNNGEWPYRYLTGTMFEYYHDEFAKILTLGNEDA